MALRYRNEQVITNLRTAYTLKYHGDSFLLDSTPETFISREPGELQSEILELNLKRELSYNDAYDDKEQQSLSTDTSPLSSIIQSGKLSDSTQLETHIGTASDSDLAVSQNAKSLMRWKELGLDLDDDSDFEDNILQATYSAAYDRKIPKQWKQNPVNSIDVASNGVRNMSVKDLFVKRDVFTGTDNNGRHDGERIETVPEPAQISSNLTNMLTSRGEDPREQYMEAVAGLRGNGNKFKMHLTGRDPIIITIKPDCSTHLAIGYTLFQADVEKGDANLYTLRLTEDDGQPDEDFPALDRVRPVASYHADEFAIVRATEAEYRENCKRTPNKVPFKTQNAPLSKPAPSQSSLQVQTNRKEQQKHMNFHLPIQPTQLNYQLSQQDLQIQRVLPIQNQDNNQSTNHYNSSLPQQYQHMNKSPALPVQLPPPVQSMHTPPQPPEIPSLTVNTPLVLPPNRLQSLTPKPTSVLPLDSAPRPTALAPFGAFQFGIQHPHRPSGPARPQRSFASSLSGTKFESILVRVYMYPYDPLLSPVFWSDDMVTRQTKMVNIFEQMCRDKMMDPEMYILRTADPARQAIDLQKDIGNFITQSAVATTITPTLPPTTPGSEISGSSNGTGNSAGALNVDIEVVALRNLPGGQQNALRPRAGSKPTENLVASTIDTSINSVSNSTINISGNGGVNAGSTNNGSNTGSSNSTKNDTSQDILKNSVLAMQQPFGFYKYSVVRLKVLGGSAKELVIDGENIHIMPPSDRSMVDQPKTTSFHIRQVIRVKQSRKTETNFSIAIMKPGGPKTYDIECQNSQIAREIVDRLQRLKTARGK